MSRNRPKKNWTTVQFLPTHFFVLISRDPIDLFHSDNTHRYRPRILRRRPISARRYFPIESRRRSQAQLLDAQKIIIYFIKMSKINGTTASNCREKKYKCLLDACPLGQEFILTLKQTLEHYLYHCCVELFIFDLQNDQEILDQNLFKKWKRDINSIEFKELNKKQVINPHLRWAICDYLARRACSKLNFFFKLKIKKWFAVKMGKKNQRLDQNGEQGVT